MVAFPKAGNVTGPGGHRGLLDAIASNCPEYTKPRSNHSNNFRRFSYSVLKKLGNHAP